MKLSPILAIATRDILKFLRDPPRIASTFIFPLLLIAVLGGSLQANLSGAVGYSLIAFTFAGVLAQTVFQSSALGIISLVEDRENDFSQEIFVSPISRYAIIVGKILGESGVSLLQAVGIIIFGLVTRIPLSALTLLALVPFLILGCLVGAAFGIIMLSNFSSQRSAQQSFAFIMFPQFFLAGVFNPIKTLPLWLSVLSQLTPLRYVVDIIRGVYYAGKPEYGQVVLHSTFYNLVILTVMFTVFLVIGTSRFVKNERNR